MNSYGSPFLCFNPQQTISIVLKTVFLHNLHFQMLICGAFDHQEEDDVDQLWNSPNSTPRKSRRNSFCKRHNKDNNKNPYSNRGLDKFSALLAELEEKRRHIYSQTGSQDISFVRFRYKNSTECVPIVVKLKDKKKEEEKKKPVDTKDHHQPGTNSESEVLDKHPIQTLIEDKVNKNTSGLQQVDEKTDEKKKQRFSWNKELHRWRRPSYYLPAFLVFILLPLVFFGRSVSILFTCIGWYIVPIIQGEGSNKARRSMKKKDYVRKLSENKFGAVRDKSSPVRDHHWKS